MHHSPSAHGIVLALCAVCASACLETADPIVQEVTGETGANINLITTDASLHDLDGSRYSWSVTDRPEGPVPTVTPAGSRGAVFVAAIPGFYELERWTSIGATNVRDYVFEVDVTGAPVVP